MKEKEKDGLVGVARALKREDGADSLAIGVGPIEKATVGFSVFTLASLPVTENPNPVEEVVDANGLPFLGSAPKAKRDFGSDDELALALVGLVSKAKAGGLVWSFLGGSKESRAGLAGGATLSFVSLSTLIADPKSKPIFGASEGVKDALIDGFANSADPGAEMVNENAGLVSKEAGAGSFFSGTRGS